MSTRLLVAALVLFSHSVCYAGPGMGPGPGITRTSVDYTSFEPLAGGMNGWVPSGAETFALGSYAHTGDNSASANIESGDTATLTKTASTGAGGSITLYYIAQLCTFYVSVDACAGGKCTTVYAGVDGTWQTLTISGLSSGSHTFTIEASSYSGPGGGSTSVFIDDITIQ